MSKLTELLDKYIKLSKNQEYVLTQDVVNDLEFYKKLFGSKYTYEVCKTEALKYKTKSEFQKGSKNEYFSAYRNKWLEEICSHMIYSRKRIEKRTKEECFKIVSKYKTSKDFYDKEPLIYRYIHSKGWLKDLRKVLPIKSKAVTKELCIEEAKKYKNKSTFFKGSAVCYHYALKNKFINELFPSGAGNYMNNGQFEYVLKLKDIGYSQRKIAKLTGLSNYVVWSIIRKHNIQLQQEYLLNGAKLMADAMSKTNKVEMPTYKFINPDDTSTNN